MPEAIPYVVHPWEGCSTGTPWGRGPELSVWFKTLFESFGVRPGQPTFVLKTHSRHSLARKATATPDTLVVHSHGVSQSWHPVLSACREQLMRH